MHDATHGDPARSYLTIKALRAGETVAFEGMGLRAATDQTFSPGATYVAQRNTGPHLATVREHNTVGGWVVPCENIYPFDTHECVVVDIIDLPDDYVTPAPPLVS